MEEFSTYQEFFFHFDPVSQLPNRTVMSSLQRNEYINASSSPTNQSDSHPPPTQESIFHGQARGVLAAENNVNCSDLTALNEEQQTNSLGPEFPQQQIPMNKKRKRTNGSCLTLAESKDGRENNRRNHKKRISTSKEKEKQAKIDKKNQKEVSEEPPTGYIHVRARRGQATDSHSLAERVRRFKISEKMKRLQDLVPGCDKITGKALVLDEIINYVQSLQHQIEFLSMKVASISPLPYDFDAALDEMAKSEKLNIQSTLASMQQSSQNLPTAILDAMIVANPTSTSYPLLDSSLALLLQQERATSLSQDNSNLLWELEGQMQSSINPDGYSNIYPFQKRNYLTKFC